MRAPLIAGNWKMHKTIAEAQQFVRTLLPQIEATTSRVWIAPPFTALNACALAAEGSSVKIGGQNLHASHEGAFTGEISGRMLHDAGASFALIGHSERRQHFHEKGEEIHKKLQAALHSKLTPLLCIGETAEEREWGHTNQVLTRQIEEALHGIEAESLVVAYEPVWAIGTGKTATPQMAQEVHHWIRETFSRLFGAPFAKQLTILYGGSVKPNNIAELMHEPDIDGALIGGAALDVDSFVQMVKLGKKS